jgi:hypothetical protein
MQNFTFFLSQLFKVNMKVHCTNTIEKQNHKIQYQFKLANEDKILSYKNILHLHFVTY